MLGWVRVASQGTPLSSEFWALVGMCHYFDREREFFVVVEDRLVVVTGRNAKAHPWIAGLKALKHELCLCVSLPSTQMTSLEV